MDTELKRDLEKLSKVPDADILSRARYVWLKQMAKEFQVPLAFAEIHLDNIGPFLKDQEKG